jgi:hypothetical protein
MRSLSLPITLVAIVAACSRDAEVRPDANAMESTEAADGKAGPPPSGESVADGSQQWAISSSPDLVIGGSTAGADQALHRVVGAVRLMDGRIVVANGGSQDLRYFDASGRLLATAGRSGGGPGEFSGLGKMFRLPGDSVAAFDGMNGRISIFSPSGSFVISRTIPAPPTVFGRFASGSLAYTVYSDPATGAATSGHIKPMLSVRRIAPEGDAGNVVTQIEGGGEYRVEEAGRVMTIPAPLSPAQPAAVNGGFLYTVSIDGSRLAVLSEDGARIREIGLGSSPARLTAAEIASYRSATLSVYPTASPRSRAHARVLAEAEYPEVAPRYDRLMVDSEGYIWVGRYILPAETVRSWDIFSATGERLGRMDTPAQVHVEEIGKDYLLGLAADALDAEEVRLYALTRGR